MLWFNFILGLNFGFFWGGDVMFHNDMIMSLKQKKRNFIPRIKLLNHNMYLIEKNIVALKVSIKNEEASRFIHSLALGKYKVLSTKVYVVASCLITLLRHAVVFLCLLRHLLGPIPYLRIII